MSPFSSTTPLPPWNKSSSSQVGGSAGQSPDALASSLGTLPSSSVGSVFVAFPEWAWLGSLADPPSF
eukprot:2822353-Amphidinium_carterae.1